MTDNLKRSLLDSKMEDNKQNEVIIHVGLHKTGTSFLQKNVFENIKGIGYRYGFSLNDPPAKEKRNIIAYEALSGRPYIPGYPDTRFIIANRLKRLFPKAKIIVGTRKIESWKKSLYHQYLINGGIFRYDQFIKKIANSSYMDQESYINYLKDLFDDVLVYSQEQLKNNTDETVKKICDFIEIDVPNYSKRTRNVSMTNNQMKMCRMINKFMYSRHNKKAIIPHVLFRFFLNKVTKR